MFLELVLSVHKWSRCVLENCKIVDLPLSVTSLKGSTQRQITVGQRLLAVYPWKAACPSLVEMNLCWGTISQAHFRTLELR